MRSIANNFDDKGLFRGFHCPITLNSYNNDGLSAEWEANHDLNPQINDTGGDLNGDGLANLAECQTGTQSDAANSDDDGMPDGWEVSNSLDPLANDAGDDLDHEGWIYLVEYQTGTGSRGPNTNQPTYFFTAHPKVTVGGL